mgnify:CR=1 FL=1
MPSHNILCAVLTTLDPLGAIQILQGAVFQGEKIDDEQSFCLQRIVRIFNKEPTSYSATPLLLMQVY